MLIERERIGQIEILTLNRPEAANSLNPPLLAELGVALEDILGDDSARVVVVTGAGEKIFCAGMDLSTLGGWEGEGNGGERPGAETLARFMGGTYEKPLVAAVNGAAVGGGMELVLSCDLVVAAEHARFGLPEVKRGLFAAGGGTLLPLRVPQAIALEMGLTGRLFSAARAAEVGHVNQVVPSEDLKDAALVLAAEVAANGPLGVQLTKRLMRNALTHGADSGMATPQESREVFGSADAREGAQAFMEKRPPAFTGH